MGRRRIASGVPKQPKGAGSGCGSSSLAAGSKTEPAKKDEPAKKVKPVKEGKPVKKGKAAAAAGVKHPTPPEEDEAGPSTAKAPAAKEFKKLSEKKTGTGNAATGGGVKVKPGKKAGGSKIN